MFGHLYFDMAERDLKTGIAHRLVGNHAPIDRVFTVKINFPIEGELKQIFESAQEINPRTLLPSVPLRDIDARTVPNI